MTQEEYRRAVDAVEFREDFVPRTLSLLEARRKERHSMKKLSLKPVLIAAALVVALAVTASATIALLSPAQVARHNGYDKLADAFDSGDAVAVDQTQRVGEYDVTLMGLASGKDLEGIAEDVDSELIPSMTYGVAAVTRADGQPMEQGFPPVTFTPLVEGYAPWHVNNWTLGGGFGSFLEDGTLYVIFDSLTLEPFADHKVLLAVYPGETCPPSAELFAFGADGAISYQPGQEGALFTLPLDPSKADPAAVTDFLAAFDFFAEPEGQSDDADAAQPEFHAYTRVEEADGGQDVPVLAIER